jgi:hypothetical protein
MAGGSALWGTVASHFGVISALTCAAIGLLAGLSASLRYRLTDGSDLNLIPSAYWPEPVVVLEPELQQGPVLVQVEYWIDPDRAPEFGRAMRDLGRARRRDGATQWGLFRDAAQPARFVETFLVETWAEHLRQHARATESDREIEKQIRTFHLRVEEPVITHLIAE